MSVRLPEAVRRWTTDPDKPLQQGAYASPLRDERLAAWLGASLGILFSVCFVTGLYSHLQQNPQAWLPIQARPAGLYRLSQGIHVAAGIASVPVLIASCGWCGPGSSPSPRSRASATWSSGWACSHWWPVGCS